jgi:hypothetical protein
MTEKTPLEKYLAGEPLNEELARLREGRPDPVEDWPLPPISPFDSNPDTQPLTASDRSLLREAKANGVLAIFGRVLKKAVQVHRTSAMLTSENDPLGHAAEISREWAYVLMFKRATLEFEQLVEAEIAEGDLAREAPQL